MESAWISSRMRSPSAAYTSWWRCTRLRPANSSETMSAWKCWPSPSTSTCSQASPPWMPALTLCGVTISIPQLVARLQEEKSNQRYGNEAHRDYRKARRRRDIRNAEETVAEAVDHVEEGVGVRQPQPEFRQRVDGIEHAGEKGERHDDEVLERGHLVDFFRQDSGHQAQCP